MHLRSPRVAAIHFIVTPISANPESAPELPIELVIYILGLLEQDEEANVGGEEMTLQSEPLKPGGSSSETPTEELGVVGARFIMAGDPSEGQFSMVEHPIVPWGSPPGSPSHRRGRIFLRARVISRPHCARNRSRAAKGDLDITPAYPLPSSAPLIRILPLA
jgi:hypothetical protein